MGDIRDAATQADNGERPASGPTERPGDPLLLTLVAALAALGLALRLRQYLFQRSLWLDEAMLAVNIASRSASELFQPLDLNQNAPPLFLMAAKAATVVMGINEWALRVVPQLAGWVVVVVLAVTLWRWLGPRGAVVGAALTALSPALIRYANEAKPYGGDAAVTVLLLSLVLNKAKEFSSARWRLLGAAGAAGIWFSHPAIFVAAAVWAGLLIRFRTSARQRRLVLVTGIVWAGAFLLSYGAVGHRDAGNERVRAGYSTAFLPPAVDSADRLPLMISGMFLPVFLGDGTSGPAISPGHAAGLLLVFGLGTAAAARMFGAWVALPLGGPIALACVAASLGLYPIGVPRLMVFWYPCIIVAAACLGSVGAPLTVFGERLRALALLLLLWPSWNLAAQSWAAPFRGDDFRRAFLEYAALDLGEPVYVSAKAQPAWIFYSTNWSPATRRQRALMTNRLRFYFAAGGDGPSFENAASRGRPVEPGEGSDLVFDFRGRLEVLGVATGRQWKWPSYVSPVDDGWATNEASRLRAAGRAANRACEWLIFERMSELSFRPLRNALRFEHGGRVERQISYPGVAIAQICH